MRDTSPTSFWRVVLAALLGTTATVAEPTPALPLDSHAVEIHVSDQELSQVLRMMNGSNATATKFRANWQSLQSIGVTPASRVTVSTPLAPLRKSLERVLASADKQGRLAYDVDGNIVHITTAEELAGGRVIRVHHLGFLQDTLPSPRTQEEGEAKERELVNAAAISIKGIAADSWGPGASIWQLPLHRVIVAQTPEVHRRIDDQLHARISHSGPYISLECRLINIDPDRSTELPHSMLPLRPRTAEASPILLEMYEVEQLLSGAKDVTYTGVSMVEPASGKPTLLQISAQSCYRIKPGTDSWESSQSSTWGIRPAIRARLTSDSRVLTIELDPLLQTISPKLSITIPLGKAILIGPIAHWPTPPTVATPDHGLPSDPSLHEQPTYIVLQAELFGQIAQPKPNAP